MKIPSIIIGLIVIVQAVNMGVVLASNPAASTMLFHSVIFIAIVAMFISVSRKI